MNGTCKIRIKSPNFNRGELADSIQRKRLVLDGKGRPAVPSHEQLYLDVIHTMTVCRCSLHTVLRVLPSPLHVDSLTLSAGEFA